MKLHQTLLFLLGTLTTTALATNYTTADFSECVLSYWEQTYPDCPITDTSCVCTKESSLIAYASSECTPKEYFHARHLFEQECNIRPRAGPSLVDPSVLAPLVLATVFFVIRLWAKLQGLAGGWGPDDTTIALSFVFGVVEYAMYDKMIYYGFGQNIWDVPFDDITNFYKHFEALAMVYKTQISLAKISVLLFLLRIFQSRVFRTFAYIMIGVNASIGITFALVDLLRCTPVHLDWDGWATNYAGGTCIDFIDAILVHCIVNIVADVIIVILPVYEVSKLQLPTGKKITVGMMFMMGLILTVVAIIRLVVFWNHRWGVNQTAGLLPLIHWSVIESQIAILTTCLPAARAVAAHNIPGMNSQGSRRTYASRGPSFLSKGQTNANSKISKSVNFSVDYVSRGPRDDNSEVHLVEMDGKYTRV
ncbi:integral membrane protein [Aspergillus japonicus CBS 114.51]|uniref:Integral membrane protein n=1 Tax=Aspergillus japonicus CBS 114.51 TaxID=1448312 RepID=A0A8T8X1G7_ASPJA|nr:integral membrane protein [Aspergillus japonicus CBS 114.51]RAH81987.1 integral membrane protein [Aspergillus japonicus CBS 114.51]